MIKLVPVLNNKYNEGWQMNRLIIVLTFLVLIIAGYFLLEDKSDLMLTVHNTKSMLKQKKAKKRSIQILYLSTTIDKGLTTKNNETLNNSKKVKITKVISEPKSLFFTEDKVQIQNIIAKEYLQEIIPSTNQNNNLTSSRYSIYAENIYNQNNEEENLPPIMPTIVTFTNTMGKKHSLVVDTQIIQNNDKIYITENNDVGEPKMLLEIPTHTKNKQFSKKYNQSKENIKLIFPPTLKK